MILQALKEYYDRKSADPASGIPKPGWECKEIPFIIVISEDGKVCNIEDTREVVGKKKTAKTFYVPQAVKRSSGVAANFMWDSVEYALGCEVPKTSSAERLRRQHGVFKERLAEAAPSSRTAELVLKFLNGGELEAQLSTFEQWQEIKKQNPFVTFKILGHLTPVFNEPDVEEYVNTRLSGNGGGARIRCLVTGEEDELEELHPSIKGLRGTNTTGGNIVSFNLQSSSSFNKKQGANAPVGKRAAFAYTTALNWLLRKESRQKVVMSDDVTVVFWSGERKAAEATVLDFEDAFAWFCGDQLDNNPDSGTSKIRALYESTQTGSFVTDNDQTLFYALGLSPNAARISVRFWQVGTVAELAERFRAYFDDLSVCHSDKFMDHLPLKSLLLSIGAPRDGRKVIEPPTLIGDVMRAVLTGLPFPETLLSTAIRRIKAEPGVGVTYARAKLIKGCINRSYRISNNQKERRLTVSLDNENTNIGYLCGRLFAVLEKIQRDVMPGINSTIGERYYNAASSTPSTAFPLLLRLKNHHLAKMNDRGAVFYEKLLGEIVGNISGGAGFPAHLSLVDQGNFAIGYYHQKNSLFAKNNETNEENNKTE